MKRILEQGIFELRGYFVVASVMLAVFLLPGYASAALVEPCGASELTAGGYLFSNYESVEYSPEGYLIHHFRNLPDFSDGRSFTLRWTFVDDECHDQGSSPTGYSVGLPAGVTDWSIRFTSNNDFDVWDDQNEAVVASFALPDYPDYTRIWFRGSIGSSSNFLRTRTHKIDIDGVPPEFPDTAEKADECADIVTNSGYYFDSLEQAEYVNGLLRVHLRLKTPYNEGRTFRMKALTADETCVTTIPSYLSMPLSTNFTPYIRYYSFRMTSPTHWVMWDDENDEQMFCGNCEGDIPEGTNFVAFYGSVDAGASTIRTTPFPPSIETVEECCSSVAFLPGFEGSVLKLGTNGLWPPTLYDVDGDLEKLKLDSNGNETNPGVVVDGVLAEFFGVPVYGGFMSYMDGLVANETIHEWKALPYDWRYSPEQIVADGVVTPSGVVDFIAQIEELAANSDTGQVTIVSHSNGGLVGKALIRELELQGKADLIDSFVMVGSPQTGTPQTIAGLLHGTGSDIAWKFITFVNKAQARSLGYNLASAHNLLPSQEYFSDVIDPVVVFDSVSLFTKPWYDEWGISINSYDEMFEFLTGEGVPRERPDEEDVDNPEVLRTSLLESAETLHNKIDSYVFPENIRVVEVVGWGLDTVKRIEYTERHGELSHELVTTVEGDGAVVYPSAENTGLERYFFDLDEYPVEVDHVNLLASTPVQAVVNAVVNEDAISTDSYVLTTKPIVEKIADKLFVSTHSPATLGVYDEFGNYTGISPNQDINAGVLTILRGIPNSGFFVFGESNYVIVPKSGNYTFTYTGTGEGDTIVVIKESTGDITTLVAEFIDVPTMEGTIAELNVNSDAPLESQLVVDVNGDGDTDTIVVADGAKQPVDELIALYKEKIESLPVKEKLKKQLLKKITQIEKKLAKGKTNQALKRLDKLEKKFIKLEMKGKIDDDDAQELLDLLDDLEKAI